MTSPNESLQPIPPVAKGWSWREGVVDVEGEHIELRYGDAGKSDYEHWAPIALIGKPTNHVFPVRWLLSASVKPEIISEAKKELDFYLVKHSRGFPGTGHPWAYAQYHCNVESGMPVGLSNYLMAPKQSSNLRDDHRALLG